jgi:hypothetical protein
MTPDQKKARAARAKANREHTRPEDDPPEARTARRTPLKTDQWARTVKFVVSRDAGLCHACRAMGCQGTGADSADHDPVPRSECAAQGVDLYDLSNLKAIHHKPCQWCGVRCNVVKASGSMAAFKLKWEEATGRKAKPSGKNPEGFAEPEGREL